MKSGQWAVSRQLSGGPPKLEKAETKPPLAPGNFFEIKRREKPAKQIDKKGTPAQEPVNSSWKSPKDAARARRLICLNKRWKEFSDFPGVGAPQENTELRHGRL